MSQPINPIPEPIGAVHYERPRAGLVHDDPTNLNSELHLVVRSPLVVYTKTQLQANAIIQNWEEIMKVVADKVDEVFANIQPEIPNG